MQQADRSHRVLVVDDCPANRALLAAILKHRKIAFEEAVDGVDALQKFKENRFDLVLMDIQMPVMDGFTTAAEVRRLSCGRPVRIFAVTASTGDISHKTFSDAGFNGKIVKPFTLKEIDDLLASSLEN